MREEDIRAHYLVQLNGHYEGSSAAEAFNLEGKTDISIRHEASMLFIAECKFWNGPRSLMDAIDQLLGYVTWRDTKTAIILFCRNHDFGRTIKSAIEVATTHPNFLLGPNAESETRYRFTFKNKNDANRSFALTLMLFSLPPRK